MKNLELEKLKKIKWEDMTPAQQDVAMEYCPFENSKGNNHCECECVCRADEDGDGYTYSDAGRHVRAGKECGACFFEKFNAGIGGIKKDVNQFFRKLGLVEGEDYEWLESRVSESTYLRVGNDNIEEGVTVVRFSDHKSYENEFEDKYGHSEIGNYFSAHGKPAKLLENLTAELKKIIKGKNL